VLLTTPLRSLGQSVIILCNADTSSSKDTDPSKDLDYYVNMRVWREGPALGVTQKYEANGAPSAVVTTLSAIESLDEEATISLNSKSKNRFIIALPEAAANPTPASLTNALKIGINMTPINMILETPDSAKKIAAVYNNSPWIMKAPLT
jgi:hypothetical protein